MRVSPTTGLVQVRSPINPGVFNSPIPQRTQHVESWWAHGPLVGMCHRKRRWYSLCTPKRARQTQNSGQLCLLLRIWPNVLLYRLYGIACAIGAIRWNKPLHHSGTAVWRSVHSWLLFGCQGRPWWIRRSGTRFQCFEIVCHFFWLMTACPDIQIITKSAHSFIRGLDIWSDTLPSELNFAVFGNLSVTINDVTRVCPEMRIAQGHKPAQNNWWIAGTTCHRQNRETPCESGLTCPCGDSNVTFHECGTDNQFYVEFD